MAGPSKAFIPFLIGMMLLTGVCNTLITKYQDNQCVRSCNDPDTSKHEKFEQPVWQTAQMFVGEMGCWLVLALSKLFTRGTKEDGGAEYEPLLAEEGEESTGEPSGSVSATNPATTQAHHDGSSTTVKELTGWRTFLLAMPAICDIIGTTLMNTGLLFVVASIYQMTRGVLVLFVGLFSVWFLNRHLSTTRWAALFIVVLGVGIVGLSGAIEQKAPPIHLPGDTEPKSLSTRILAESGSNPDSPLRMLFGMSLIFLAQMFTASQFVLEESIMHSSTIGPLQMVAFEGTFGLILTLFGQVILHFAYGSTSSGRGGYFDMTTGWHEIIDHRAIWTSSLLIMVCIGAFNFFGLSVTRNVSATSRSTIDTCRVLFVWLTSLGLGWERFRWLQVVGFALLVYGTFLYNEIVSLPWVGRRRQEETRSD